MKKFVPQSPNPNIRKSSDATLAILGQVNKVVEEVNKKGDAFTPSTFIFDWYFTVTPSMQLTSDTYTILGDGNQEVPTYKLKGIIWVDEESNEFSYYAGSIVYKEGCDFFTTMKQTANINEYFDEEINTTSFTKGGSFFDFINGQHAVLTDAGVWFNRYSFEDNGQVYYGYDIYFYGTAADALSIQGEIAFEFEFLYHDFCVENRKLEYYLY